MSKKWRLRLHTSGAYDLYFNGVLWSSGRAYTKGVATLLRLRLTRFSQKQPVEAEGYLPITTAGREEVLKLVRAL